MISDLEEVKDYYYNLSDLYQLYSQKARIVAHAVRCKDENCEYCDFLCNSGIIISCDECGYIHHTDWIEWEMSEDNFIFCPTCFKNNE